MSHLYKLLYQVETKPEGVKKEDVPKGYGACDALLLASLIYPEDGSLSLYFVGRDGRTGEELQDHEWFKVWGLLAHRLAKSKTLDEGRKSLCAQVHQVIWDALNAPEGTTPSNGAPKAEG